MQSDMRVNAGSISTIFLTPQIDRNLAQINYANSGATYGANGFGSVVSSWNFMSSLVSQRVSACHCPIPPDAYGASGTDMGLETPHLASLEKSAYRKLGCGKSSNRF